MDVMKRKGWKQETGPSAFTEKLVPVTESTAAPGDAPAWDNLGQASIAVEGSVRKAALGKATPGQKPKKNLSYTGSYFEGGLLLLFLSHH